MPWLRHLPHPRRAAERGATTILVAIFVPLVFIGLLSMTVDYGNATFERRQLQNAADGSALAFAQVCAESAVNCNPSTAYAASVLNPVLNGNSADALSQLNKTTAGPYPMPDGICGRNTGGTSVPACPTGSVSDLAQCPPLPSWLTSGTGLDIPYVEAYSKTKVSGGGSVLPSFFSSALPGGPGQNITERACARAAWGPTGPSSQIVLGLTMSECDWKSITGYNDTVTPPTPAVYPPGPVGVPGYDTDASTPQPPWPAEKYVYSKGNDTTCETSSPGGTAPGGFGWLASDGNCKVNITITNWLQTRPGGAGCTYNQLLPYWSTVVYVPVFDCVVKDQPASNTVLNGTLCNTGVGNNTWYHIAGFAAFYLSGWNLNPGNGDMKPSVATGATTCPAGGSSLCLFGWFLHDLIPAGSILPPPPGGTPNYGLNAVVDAG